MSTSAAGGKKAVVVASPKLAALYYDRILPVPGRPEYIREAYELFELPEERTKPLLDGDDDPYGWREIVDVLAKVSMTSQEELAEKHPAIFSEESDLPRFRLPGEQAAYWAVCRCIDASKMELVLSEPPITKAHRLRGRRRARQSTLLTLVNLRLVDASAASWDQILEFRQDNAARAAFVKMRTFLFESSARTSTSDLSDRVVALVDDYEQSVRKHGFEARAAGWEVLLNKQILIDALSMGGLGAQLGGPFLGATAAGMALTFDCGRAVLTAKRKLLESERVLGTHPANWIFMARSALSQPQESEQRGLISRIWRRFV